MRLHIKYIKCRRVLSSVPCKNYKSVCAILPISFWFMSSCNFCSFYVFFEGKLVVWCWFCFLFYYILFFVAISHFSYILEKHLTRNEKMTTIQLKWYLRQILLNKYPSIWNVFQCNIAINCVTKYCYFQWIFLTKVYIHSLDLK